MRLFLNKKPLLATLAYLYWFLENAKYGVALLFFADSPAFLFVVTAISAIGIFLLTMAVSLKLWLQGQLKPNDTPMPREVKLLWVFVVLSGLSLLWTNMLEFNFKIWVNIVLSIVTFYLLTRYGDAKETAVQTVKGFVHGAVFTAAVALVVHPIETASIHRLGLFGLIDATRLGRMMGMTALFVVYHLFTAPTRREKVKQCGMLAIVITTLGFTFAKISLACTFITVVMMILLFKIPFKLKATIVTGAVVVAGLFVAMSYQRIIGYTELMGGNALSSVSGRTTYWTVSWAMIKANPLMGYGAGARLNLDAIPLDQELSNITEVKPTQTHNEWMNMWFQYGLAGLFLAILIYGLLLARAIKGYQQGERELTVLCLGMLVLTFLRSPFESDLVGFILPEPFLIIFAFWLKAQLTTFKNQRYANLVMHPKMQLPPPQFLPAAMVSGS